MILSASAFLFAYIFVPNYYKKDKKSNLKLSIDHPTPSK